MLSLVSRRTIHIGKIWGDLSKLSRNMDKVYFRHRENDSSVDISFRYANSVYKIDRVFNFRRNISEQVEVFTERMRTNIEKEFGKRNKKQKKKPEEAAATVVAPPQVKKINKDIPEDSNKFPIIPD